MKKSFFSLLICFAFVVPALGQGGHVTPGGASFDAQAPDTITRPGSVGDLGIYDYWSDMSGQGRAGSVLLGKLTVEGERMPWDPIMISVLCNGKILQSTQTDALGRFVIPATKSFCHPASACSQTHPEQLPLEGCSVQASASGFGSSAITITQRNLRDDPFVGTLTIFRKEGRGAGSAVSATDNAAPVEAVASFEKARKEFIAGKNDKAESDLQKALQLDPKYSDAWYQLGNLEQSEHRDQAREDYAKSIAADPNFVLPYEQLAYMDAQEGKWPQVVDDTNHQLGLDPHGTLQTWYYNAMANFQLKNFDAAQASAEQSIALDPQHLIPTNERLVAIILAKKGDLPGALEHLRKCLQYTPPGPDANLLKKQIAMLESKTSAAK